jgi:5S rRNA maturation endonuclease (ribonuclease M5)
MKKSFEFFLKFLWIFLGIFIGASTNAYADVRLAKIYALGKTDAPALFNQRIETKDMGSGITHESATITDPSGILVLTEDSDYRGEELIHQMIKKFQTNEAYEVLVDGKKVTFRSFQIKDDKLIPVDHEKSEIPGGEFITGPVLEPFIQKHWQEFQKGDTIHVRLGVLELAETVGFKFWQYAQTKIADKPLIDIRMKASSIFIAMAVSPVDLFFDPATKRLIRFKGRTPLKMKSNGKLVPLDADIIYD